MVYYTTGKSPMDLVSLGSQSQKAHIGRNNSPANYKLQPYRMSVASPQIVEWRTTL